MNRGWYGSIITWFAHNSVAANLLMVVLLVGGLFSMFTIKKEIQPAIDTNFISVSVPYLGAGPEEVEEGICLKIEEAIQDLQGIKKITCFASEGSGTVNVETEQEYDVLEVMDNIKIRVDSISTFPTETERPVISRQQFEQPVMWVSVYGDVDERTLKEFAREVRDDLVALPDVTRAELVGSRSYEIGIELSEYSLQQYGLTFDEVARALRANSLDLPGGSIQSRAGDILLRTKGQAYQGGEFANIVVRTNRDGSRVLLSDVATINDGFSEVERYAQHNGKPSVSIRVLAVGNQDSLKISAAVRNYIEQSEATLPSGIGVAGWADLSYYLEGRLDLMQRNLFTGAILVFLVLALFLRLKLAFWVMMGLPIAFMGAFFLMPTFDVTINMLSLFGFILVLGIVVDDAIVIGESAYSSIREKGHSIDNVVDGVMKVAVPATFGVLTTAAAFLPILMISGIFGQFFKPIGLVVVLCLLFSLVESKLILPAHLAHMKVKRFRDVDPASIGFFQRMVQRVATLQGRFSDGVKHFVHRRYKPVLTKALKHRYLTLMGFMGVLIISFGLLAGGQVRSVFFPDIDGDFIQVNIEMNEGSPAESLHRTLDLMRAGLETVDQDMAAELGREPGTTIDTIFAFAGSNTSGQVVVELVKDEINPISVKQVTDLWREVVGDIPGTRQLSFSSAGGPQAGPAIAFELSGKDIDQLSRAAAELEAKIREYDNVNDIRNSFEAGAREIKLTVKPEAEALGLTLQDLARQVRQGFYGEEVQRIQRGQDDVRVMLRYPRDQRSSLAFLQDMRIRTLNGEAVPFETVANIEHSSSPTVIRRVGRERAVNVTAEVDKDQVDPGVITREIAIEFLPQLLAKYPSVSSQLDGASADTQKIQLDLAKGALFALFLIYALMAIPLKSYLQPLLIMSVIPFGVIGAIVGHWIAGFPLSMLSWFGIIALSGVVVNDSLILVDFVNRSVRKGVPVIEAAVDGAVQRFRPILLTSLTTFLGLVPIVLFESSLQARIVQPMATSLAFGILFATLITLFLIPVLYHILVDVKSRLTGSKPADQRTDDLGSATPVETL